jgi:NAD(P)-dependent dehydrogenase (short-subunit alcohol dehydrogenase family)
VNELVPGWVFTERQEALWASTEAVERHMAKQCIKRKVMPPDIARMALWLAADDSAMVTAQYFVVDGGGV